VIAHRRSTADSKMPVRTCPRLRADTSKSCVRENFSGLSRKRLARRIPDTCADTSGHGPPKRVRGGGCINTPPRGRRAAVAACVPWGGAR
jgi:hypothetical protein